MLFNKRNISGLFVMYFFVMFVGIVLSSTSKAGDFKAEGSTLGIITSVPRTMTYQGMVKDDTGQPIMDDTLEVTFRIYDAIMGGSELWNGTDSVITDDGGYFSANLGNLNLPFDEDYYLQVEIEQQVLSPRQKLNMSAYSARTDTSDHASNADLLDGMDSGDFALVDHNHDNEYVNENQPNSITGDMIVDETILFGDIGQNAATVDQVMKWDGSAWMASDDEVGAGGGGWTDDGTVVRLETGTDSVGIGTTDPSEKLEIEGNILISGKAKIGTGNANVGLYAFVAGENDTASGDYATIGGGKKNTASAYYTTIGGGNENAASNVHATVGGGWGNTASGSESTVGGGYYNTAGGEKSTVGGGVYNTASNHGTVGGGLSNNASGYLSTVSGGSHNNASQDYSIVGGGYDNTTTGNRSTVSGGDGNTASGDFSTVSGGDSCSASGGWSIVGGGNSNTAEGDYSIVAGGQYNIASALGSTVGGGYLNKASGGHSVISGGNFNVNEGNYSAITGGYADTITTSALMSYLFGIGSKLTEDSTFMVDMPHIRFGDEVSGYEFPTSDGETDNVLVTDGSGQLNWIELPAGGGGWTDDGTIVRLETSTDSVGIGTTTPSEKLDVSGNIKASGTISSGSSITIDGVNNEITSTTGTIDFDNENLVTTGKATVGPNNTNIGGDAFVAGSNNIARGAYSVVSGGGGSTAADSNSAIGDYSTIGGGQRNIASQSYTAVGGGQYNTASGLGSTVSGGYLNAATHFYSTVGGGASNTASGEKSIIGGGQVNIASGLWSTVGGGYGNTASGGKSTVCGGRFNRAPGQYAVVSGGGGDAEADSNSAIGDYSAISGGQRNIASHQHSTISGGYGNTASGNYSTVSGGQENTASGYRSTISGGYQNSNAGGYSAIPGGQNDTITTIAYWSMAFGARVYLNNSYRVALFEDTNHGRLGINRDDHDGGISHPIHVGTRTINGNGAYLSAGGVWTNGSSREFKENFQPMDSQQLLSKISSMQVDSWNFKDSDEKHIGPVAEDFVSAFDVGTIRETDGQRDNHYLAASDVAGVALAGVQALLDKIEQLEKRIAELEAVKR